MVMYKISSGRMRPMWLTTLYSILTIAVVGVMLWLILPFILAFIAVLILAAATSYWWLRWKLKKMVREQSSAFDQDQEDDEYVDFEVIDE